MSLLSLDRIAGMNCHYRFYTLEDFFAALQRNGITHAELWTCASHFLLDPFSWQDTKALRRLAKRYGVQIICLTPEQNNPKPYNLAARDPELICRTRCYFLNAICAAQELECGLVSCSSGWSFYSEPTQEAWKRAVAMLHTLAEEAYRRGVTLVMETLLPRETRLVCTLEEEKRMLAEINSPGIKANLDLGSMAAAGETISQWFAALGEDTIHCHFVDGHPAGHLAWGEGERDPGQDLEDFARNGYRGYFTLEFLSPDYYGEPWRAEERSLRTLSAYLK
ncbi:MAG: sugar phosphate isomerase/epimerase [Clostridiales bacterium]|nr:sugar phosphate isomerase/epimerase [Clostridiales bacterium]